MRKRKIYSTSYKLISTCLVLTITASSYLFYEQKLEERRERVIKTTVTLGTEAENIGLELNDFTVGIVQSQEKMDAEQHEYMPLPSDANEKATELELQAVVDHPIEPALDKLKVLLAEQLSNEVSLNVFTNYEELVTALEYGKIQLAFLGPTSYVLAHERSGAQAIASMMVEGQADFYSYMITYKDAPWESLEEFIQDDSQQLSVAFNEPFSFAGALVPLKELSKWGVGLDLQVHPFENILLTDSYEALGKAVKNKEVDAGFIDSIYYELFQHQGLLDEQMVKIIWQSEPLFHHSWAVSYQVGDKTLKLLQQFFTQLQDEEILRYFGASGFRAVSDEDYNEVREVIESIEGTADAEENMNEQKK